VIIARSELPAFSEREKQCHPAASDGCPIASQRGMTRIELLTMTNVTQRLEFPHFARDRAMPSGELSPWPNLSEPDRSRDFLRTVAPRLPVIVALLARCAGSAPPFWAGWILDDYLHRSIMREDSRFSRT